MAVRHAFRTCYWFATSGPGLRCVGAIVFDSASTVSTSTARREWGPASWPKEVCPCYSPHFDQRTNAARKCSKLLMGIEPSTPSKLRAFSCVPSD